MQLPDYCYDCGVYLMGGATVHEPGCSIRQLIEDAVKGSEPPSEAACDNGKK